MRRSLAAGAAALALGWAPHTLADEALAFRGPVILDNGVATQADVAVSAANPLPVAVSNNTITVTGNATNGQATNPNPVTIGGYDGSGVRTLATTVGGYLKVTGDIANGSAFSGNGLLVGGWDGSNFRFLSTNTTGQLNIASVSSGGSSSFAGATGLRVLGFDGANDRILKTDTLGILYAQGSLSNGTSSASNPGLMVGGSDGSNYRHFAIATDGALRIANQAGASLNVSGAIASGSADSGNPNKIGCRYNATRPTFSDGQRADCQSDTRGSLGVAIYDANGSQGAAVDGTAGNGNSMTGSLRVSAIPRLSNGSTFDPQLAVNALGASGGSQGVAATSNVPTGSQGQGIPPTATSALASNLVAKAAAANLYRWTVTTGGSAGYVLIFDATSAPADGAVTPKECVAAPANSTVRDNIGDFAERYATGITIVFSTTGCFTKTASATAFIKAEAF